MAFEGTQAAGFDPSNPFGMLGIMGDVLGNQKNGTGAGGILDVPAQITSAVQSAIGNAIATAMKSYADTLDSILTSVEDWSKDVAAPYVILTILLVVGIIGLVKE